MPYKRNTSFLLLVIILVASCKKNTDSATGCFAGAPTVRQITNQQAVIKADAGNFYLIEQGSIDSKLKPCSLAAEFRVHGLRVIISGDVKETAAATGMPCCTENFIITGISR